MARAALSDWYCDDVTVIEGCNNELTLPLLGIAVVCVTTALDVTEAEGALIVVVGTGAPLDTRHVDTIGAVKIVVEAVGVTPMTVGPISTYSNFDVSGTSFVTVLRLVDKQIYTYAQLGESTNVQVVLGLELKITSRRLLKRRNELNHICKHTEQSTCTNAEKVGVGFDTRLDGKAEVCLKFAVRRIDSDRKESCPRAVASRTGPMSARDVLGTRNELGNERELWHLQSVVVQLAIEDAQLQIRVLREVNPKSSRQIHVCVEREDQIDSKVDTDTQPRNTDADGRL